MWLFGWVMAKKRSRKFNKIVRRVHLYLGLVLIPWLLLYGFTALLFNHGSWLTERRYIPLEQSDEQLLPSAEELALKAVNDMEQDDLSLIPSSAKWVGSVHFRGSLEGHSVRIGLNPQGDGGMLRIAPTAEEDPEWVGGLDNWTPISEDEEGEIVKRTADLVALAESSVEDISIRRYPRLQFQVRKKDALYTVNLDLDGDMELESATGASAFRSRLLRLHTVHGTPGYTGAVWLWSWIVDLMGVAMIVWAATGVVMWWTICGVRMWGAVALATGGVVIAILALSLWSIFGL